MTEKMGEKMDFLDFLAPSKNLAEKGETPSGESEEKTTKNFMMLL